MRRWAALFLLVLTLLLPMQPLLANAQQQSSLPACCRRNGMHHCVMSMDGAVLQSGNAPVVTSGPCRWWKLTAASTAAATAISVFHVSSQPAIAGCIDVTGISVPRLNRWQRSPARAPPLVNL